MSAPAARTVFLTGATGFIGARLARRLAERGDTLRCLVRPTSDTSELRRLGARLVPGDVNDVDAMAAGMAGADLAYHLAAIYDIGVVDEGALERVNVGGTRDFLAALRRAGVPRAVYVSTTLALGPVEEGEGDEHSTHDERWVSAYERTKVEAHRLARAAQRGGLPLGIACPAYVYGPGDDGPGGRFLRDLRRRRVPALPYRTNWYSFVHVDDVADGLLRLGEAGRPGESWVLSGEHRDFREFARAAARLMGVGLSPVRLPTALVRATGAALDVVSRATGVRFPVTREGADVAGGGRRYLHSHAKATRELGWTPRPLAEGLGETVAVLEVEDR
ncbi:MAG TPA: NAD-dependent epimerase/dehydratase family protein [Longimicrobiales bacterium]|nr:NAD-dependent epimerase/dehydratase family protein [Longimicrobiales bacterium]